MSLHLLCMARIVATYLLILYTAFTTGLAIDVHYCGGKVSSVSFEKQSEKDACGKCKKANSHCCHNEVRFLKVNDAHSVVAVKDVPACPETLLTFNNLLFNISSLNGVGSVTYSEYSPPLKSPPDIFIRNCVFRI